MTIQEQRFSTKEEALHAIEEAALEPSEYKLRYTPLNGGRWRIELRQKGMGGLANLLAGYDGQAAHEALARGLSDAGMAAAIEDDAERAAEAVAADAQEDAMDEETEAAPAEKKERKARKPKAEKTEISPELAALAKTIFGADKPLIRHIQRIEEAQTGKMPEKPENMGTDAWKCYKRMYFDRIEAAIEAKDVVLVETISTACEPKSGRRKIIRAYGFLSAIAMKAAQQ
jgi:hypothetical protein